MRIKKLHPDKSRWSLPFAYNLEQKVNQLFDQWFEVDFYGKF